MTRRNLLPPARRFWTALPCLLLGLTALPLTAQDATPPLDPDETIRIQLAGASRYAPVTLSARDLDILEIFRMLSRSRGLNIVAGDEVKGPVTLELREVPFEEALRAVAAVKGFEITRRGDIWFVHKPESGDAGASVMHESRSYRLDYASPEDLLPVIESMLSGSGSAMAYPPLRALVVEDRPSVLDRVGAILEALDQPRRQVLIEAQIIEARLSSDFRFGIDWSMLLESETGSGDIQVQGFAGTAESGQGLFVTWGEGDFMGALEAFEGVDDLNVVAAPRLLALDGSSALIQIGGQLGFPVTTTVENRVMQSVEFLDTGTKLVVTPTITGDGYIQMRIHPEVSDGVVEEGLPSKSTATVETDVLIRDGDTLLIGGMIRERTEKSRKGVPLLMHIPLLGGLFGRTVSATQRSELITVITPHIIEPGEQVAYEGNGLIHNPPILLAAPDDR